MVQITLTNRNACSSHRQAVINVITKQCIIDEATAIPLQQLLHQTDFEHPLLIEPFTPNTHHQYTYTYHDIDSMLYAAIYVYSTLLNTNHALACQFTITPAKTIKSLPIPNEIYISIHPKKAAKETLSIKKLNALLSHLRGYSFEFSEDTLIDDSFSITDLPDTIDGDKLYETDETITQLLKIPSNSERYELRYINPIIGFGAYCRENIKKGSIIATYNGIKTAQQPDYLQYTYSYKLDLLKLYTNSRHYGNFSRFLNHAPLEENAPSKKPRMNRLKSNIKADTKYVHGIGIIIYSAKRDIAKGEQLLASYGSGYFDNCKMHYFNKKGNFITGYKKWRPKYMNTKRCELRTIAHYGVHQARVFLFKRMLWISGGVAILASILNYKN